MNKNKTALLIAVCLITNTACTESPQPQEHPQKQERNAYLDKHYKKLPQSVLDGIPFPATKEQAKLAGFADCQTSGDKQFKCSLNRKIKFEDYEFESAYVLLNTEDNLTDYPKSTELGWEVSDNGRFQADLSRASLTPSTEYSYRSIHFMTKNTGEPSCNKRNTQFSKKKYSAFERPTLEDCASDSSFREKLEKNGWLRICYEAANGACAYYTKTAHFRIVHRHSSDFEIEPLPPSQYGIEHKKATEQHQSETKSKAKVQTFIDSMRR